MVSGALRRFDQGGIDAIIGDGKSIEEVGTGQSWPMVPDGVLRTGLFLSCSTGGGEKIVDDIAR
jgi:hypothetical protein